MSVRLDDEEAWEVVEGSHTGILTTLRADGAPVALPIWFVVDHCTVCFMTFEGTKKLSRMARDPRASFLVESGRRWAELRAVHLSGVVEPVEDDAARAQIDALLEAKYATYRTARAKMPDRTTRVYATKRFFRFVPDERMLTWDNSRLTLKQEP